VTCNDISDQADLGVHSANRASTLWCCRSQPYSCTLCSDPRDVCGVSDGRALQTAAGELATHIQAAARALPPAQIIPFCLPELIVAEAAAAAPNGGSSAHSPWPLSPKVTPRASSEAARTTPGRVLVNAGGAGLPGVR
jgi:hypothetical protein